MIISSLGIFDLFCYNEEVYMQKGEFKYMMNKLCNSIAATIQIKKTFLQELMRNVDSKLLSLFSKDHIHQMDFVNSMNMALRELSDRLSEISMKCDTFSLQVRQHRIPEFLLEGNIFLGQYGILEAIPYSKIHKYKLMQYPTVFGHILTAKQMTVTQQ